MGSITLKAADGFEFSAYEAAPQGSAKGAIVVIQEVFGVNSHIRSLEPGFYFFLGYCVFSIISGQLMQKCLPGPIAKIPPQ